MNANAANTEEKYAWVDAELENCALQEQRDYEEQAMDIEEANPEWNEEDGAEEDGAEEEPGNIDNDADLCLALLDRPPPLTRQNACFLMEVVDELTGDISLVESDCYGRVEVDEPDEDLIANGPMEADGEDEDQALYNLKRYQELTFAPFKRHKTHHEHPIPEPMDICDSEEEDDRDYMSENDDLEPRQLFNDDEDDKLSIMSDIEVEPVDDECGCGHDCDENELCLDCIWFLEQEALHRFPRRARQEQIPVQAPIVEDPHADLIFPVFDEEGEILPIPMEVVQQEEDEAPALNLGPAPCFQRANTFWVDEEAGQIVHNGNPNGLRFYNEEDNLAEERYHSNVYELEVTYRNGQNVHNRDDADRVAWLINAIEEYNRRDQHKF
jgi:hypothetical protein